MRHAIAINGAFFNTHRMLEQYVVKAYLLFLLKGNLMPDWLWFVVIFVAYIVLMRWVLPRFGVPT